MGHTTYIAIFANMFTDKYRYLVHRNCTVEEKRMLYIYKQSMVVIGIQLELDGAEGSASVPSEYLIVKQAECTK